MYAYGQGVPEDDVEAVKWYHLSAVNGDVDTKNQIGEMHLDGGLGVGGEGLEEALKWFRLAAEQGKAENKYSLGRRFRYGFYKNSNSELIGKNLVEAIKWFRLAADQGYAYAQKEIGGIYENGDIGITQDFVEAVKWYRLAAEQGDFLAQNRLGKMYRDARGVPQDYVLAHMWFSLAASGDIFDPIFSQASKEEGIEYKSSKEERDLVATKMTPRQINQAQELARNWKPNSQLTASKWEAIVSENAWLGLVVSLCLYAVLSILGWQLFKYINKPAKN